MRVHSLGQKDPLEKEMATHSSIFAWEIPCTEELDRLQSMGSQTVGHSTHTSFFPLCLSMTQNSPPATLVLIVQRRA